MLEEDDPRESKLLKRRSIEQFFQDQTDFLQNRDHKVSSALERREKLEKDHVKKLKAKKKPIKQLRKGPLSNLYEKGKMKQRLRSLPPSYDQPAGTPRINDYY